MRKNKNKPIYKKVWFWIAIILIFLASLCIIVAINESYKKGGYATLWDATDALAFYGDYLSFTGTVIIGIIAIFMSNKANALSEKLLILKQEIEKHLQ